MKRLKKVVLGMSVLDNKGDYSDIGVVYYDLDYDGLVLLERLMLDNAAQILAAFKPVLDALNNEGYSQAQKEL